MKCIFEIVLKLHDDYMQSLPLCLLSSDPANHLFLVISCIPVHTVYWLGKPGQQDAMLSSSRSSHGGVRSQHLISYQILPLRLVKNSPCSARGSVHLPNLYRLNPIAR